MPVTDNSKFQFKNWSAHGLKTKLGFGLCKSMYIITRSTQALERIVTDCKNTLTFQKVVIKRNSQLTNKTDVYIRGWY